MRKMIRLLPFALCALILWSPRISATTIQNQPDALTSMGRPGVDSSLDPSLDSIDMNDLGSADDVVLNAPSMNLGRDLRPDHLNMVPDIRGLFIMHLDREVLPDRQPVAVPEPASFTLLTGALLWFPFRKRRSR